MHSFIHAGGALALAAICAAPPALADVRDSASERSFSLSGGTPALVLPRSDWVINREQRRPGDTAAYYMVSSEQARMVLSVYVDKTTVCQSGPACLQEALKNKAYQDAKDQAPLPGAGPFSAVQFYLDQPQGAPAKQAHILASAYVDGHWFDVHISKTETERPDMAPLAALLKSLAVR